MASGRIKRILNLVSVNDLVETEDHCAESAKKLAERMISIGFWTVPIAVESSMMAIMDGHHRLNASKYIGLTRVPCTIMSYEDGGVSLMSWRNDVVCTVVDIRRMVERGEKYPLKTTRHVFNPSIDEIKIPLEVLY